MACGSSALVCFLLSFSGGGGGSVGAVSGEDRWSLLLLLAVTVDVAGEQGVRLVLLYLLACGVELWSSPLLGSLSGWPASSSSTILDFFPASRRRICFLRWPWCGERRCSFIGGRCVPVGMGRRFLRLTKGFGLSGDGDGWICFQSGQTELLGEDDALDLDVISRSCRVLYAKGGCTRCTVHQ